MSMSVSAYTCALVTRSFRQESQTLWRGGSGTLARLRYGCRAEPRRQLRRRPAAVLRLAVLGRGAVSEHDGIPAAHDALRLPRIGRRSGSPTRRAAGPGAASVPAVRRMPSVRGRLNMGTSSLDWTVSSL